MTPGTQRAGPAPAIPVRPPGRPRSDRVHQAILDAAIELFGELGFEAMSVEGVAARAGVGKATIYRRWRSKQELIVEAMGSLVEVVDVPDTGSVREDLIATVRNLTKFMTNTKSGRVLPRMVAEVAGGTPLGRSYVDAVIKERRALAARAVERGVRRGELRPDLDVEIVVDSIVGPVLLHRLLGDLAGMAEDLPERLVDSVLRGCRMP